MRAPSHRRKRRGRCLPIVMRRARRMRRRGPRLLTLTASLLLLAITRELMRSGLALVRMPFRPRSSGLSNSDSYGPIDPSPEGPPPASPAAAPIIPPPPENDVAWAIRFLVRNRARPGPVTERAWRILDRSSLPLAIYLREVEDRGDWSNLERELKVPLPPDRRRHRDVKVVAAAVRWEDRGVNLLFPPEEPGTAIVDIPNVETSPRPPGP